MFQGITNRSSCAWQFRKSRNDLYKDSNNDEYIPRNIIYPLASAGWETISYFQERTDRFREGNHPLIRPLFPRAFYKWSDYTNGFVCHLLRIGHKFATAKNRCHGTGLVENTLQSAPETSRWALRIRVLLKNATNAYKSIENLTHAQTPFL